MLFLLRNIRRKLFSNKKIGTYILYAIGEIFLVVIGILIALQVNNWNENRKFDRQELAYLHRLIRENKSDVLTFETEIQRLESNNEKITNLSKSLKDKDCPDSVLVRSAVEFMIHGSLYPRFNPSVSTYEDLSSTGNLGIITDTELRDQIVAHYQSYGAVEWEFKVNADWAVPIDAPLFIQTDALRFDTASTSFLFSELPLGDMAAEIRAKQEMYLRNAALHFWINKDAIVMLKKIKSQTLSLLKVLEKPNEQTEEKIIRP